MGANLSSELLRTFVTVVDVDGFNRAAERLHKTPSTVSQQIQRLEAELGVALFEPHGRKRRLSAAGERFVGYAKRLLALQEAAVAAVNPQGPGGEIRLGVSHGLSEGAFADVLGGFARRYPGVRLHVDVGFSCDLAAAFERAEYDAVLTLRTAARGPGRVLGSAPLQWIVADDLAWDPATPLPLAVFAEPCAFRGLAVAALDEAGIPWAIRYTTGSLPGLMAAVRSGLGVTLRTQHALVDGCRVADPALGLPRLPRVDVVFRRARRSAEGALLEELFAANPPAAA
ncbi:MAG: LysR substrate-binding domain-containing protein [Gammaproteobacteria bacterium]|nr:LysR substrate-binding domain-containing protein [Gammaproteobacteria bacterium]